MNYNMIFRPFLLLINQLFLTIFATENKQKWQQIISK